MKLFQDHDGYVLLHRNAREARVTRGDFQLKFPDYQMPANIVTRRWDGSRHHLFDAAGNQSLGSGIPDSQFEEYLDAISYFKELEAEPAQPEAEPQPHWLNLESVLVGSSAWATMLAAMSTTNRCNAAGTLILSAFALKNHAMLIEGFASLIDAMEAKTAPEFSDEELAFIREALEEAGFEAQHEVLRSD